MYVLSVKLHNVGFCVVPFKTKKQKQNKKAPLHSNLEEVVSDDERKIESNLFFLNFFVEWAVPTYCNQDV